jgi:hypothetical protein
VQPLCNHKGKRDLAMGGVGYWFVGGLVVAGLMLGVSLWVTAQRKRLAVPAGLAVVSPQAARHAAAAPIAPAAPSVARAAATLAAPAWAPASTSPAAWLPEPVSSPTWRPADYPR